MHRRPRPPIPIAPVLDDPDQIRRLVERHAPYLPVQRYFRSDAEFDASSGTRPDGGAAIIAPNFRGDWAYDRPLVDGVEPLLNHPGFVEAAGKLFDSSLVRPQIVYVNLTWRLPFDQGAGHIDVPAFRGIDRTRYPIWLLNAMGHSGLFEAERIHIATAVAWFYKGTDGGFTYWPDGPDAPPMVHEGNIHNTAFMGDNDAMFHRVRPVGSPRDGMLTGMTLDTKLAHVGGDDWQIVEGDTVRGSLSFSDLRISLSWKAQVFRDAAEQRSVDEHLDDIALEDVIDRFASDLGARGVAFERPQDPVNDPDFVTLLAKTYVTQPTVFD